jgi:hypothetical protein
MTRAITVNLILASAFNNCEFLVLLGATESEHGEMVTARM